MATQFVNNEFPVPLREMIKGVSPLVTDLPAPVCDALVQESVQRQFLTWADSNDDVVRFHPLLSKISTQINKNPLLRSKGCICRGKELLVFGMKSLFYSISPFQKALNEWLLEPTHAQNKVNLKSHFRGSPQTIAPIVIAYRQAGLLTDQQFMDFLQDVDIKSPASIPLAKEIMSEIERLPNDQLIQLVSGEISDAELLPYCLCFGPILGRLPPEYRLKLIDQKLPQMVEQLNHPKISGLSLLMDFHESGLLTDDLFIVVLSELKTSSDLTKAHFPKKQAAHLATLSFEMLNRFIQETSFELWYTNLEHFLPILKNLSKEEVVAFVSIKDKSGGTFLQYRMTGSLTLFNFADRFDLTPLLMHLPVNILIEQLKIKTTSTVLNIKFMEITYSSNKQQTPLHVESLIPFFLPYLHQVPLVDLIKLVVLKDAKGNQPIQNKLLKDLIMERFKKEIKSVNDFLALCQMKLSDGTPLLANSALTPLLEVYTSLLRWEDYPVIFAMLDTKNWPVFGKILIDLVNRAPDDKFLELMQLQGKDKKILLHYFPQVDYSPLSKKLSQLTSSQILTLSTILDENGEPFAPVVFFLLEKMSLEERSQASAHEFPEGNIFHIFEWEKKINKKYNWLGSKFSTPNSYLHLPNKIGLTPFFFQNLVPSLSWLTKPKKVRQDVALTMEEYPEKALELVKDIVRMLEGVTFGTETGQVPLNTVSKYPLDKLKEKLGKFLETIAKQEAWLGTPKSTEKEKLHKFYCEMYHNLRSIVDHLKILKDPHQTAGYLIGLANISIDGRCAAAFQGEILQSATLLENQNNESELSVLKKVERACQLLLQSMVGENLQEIGGQNVHYYNHFCYAVGLIDAPDHLIGTEIEEVQKKIVEKWDIASVLKKVRQPLDRIPKEELFAWFKDNTPATFDPESLALRDSLESVEKDLTNKMEEQITQHVSNPSHVKALAAFFASPRGAGLRVTSSFKRSRALETAVHQLTVAEMKVFQTSLSGDVLVNLFIEKGSMPKVLPDPNIKREFIEQLHQIAARNTLQLELEKIVGKCSPDVMNGLIQIKAGSDQLLSQMARERQIDFIPEIHGLPSRAIDDSRKSSYAQLHFYDDRTIKPLSLVKLLYEAGVFSSKFAP